MISVFGHPSFGRFKVNAGVSFGDVALLCMMVCLIYF